MKVPEVTAIVFGVQVVSEIETFCQMVVARGRGRIGIQMRCWHVKKL